MISRITEVRDVGCLKRFCPDKADEFAFGKNTVIFATNATGKTTLAAVLKSYGTDNPSLLNCRGTLSSRQSPFAALELDDGRRRFQNGAWHNRQEGECPVIVFDNAFIEENVFSNEVTPDHLKSIHRLIVGRDGLALNSTLEKAKDSERTASRELKRLDGELRERQRLVGRVDYLDLADHITAAEAASRLEACEGKLKAAQGMVSGEAAPVPVIEPFALGNFAALRDVLKKTIASAHEEARTRVRERIRTVLHDAPEAESFLETGKRLAPADGQCPFCGQDTSPVASLLQDYEQYFDTAFADLKKDIGDRTDRFRAWSPSGHLRKWQAAYAQAVTAREKWARVIPALPELPGLDAPMDELAKKADTLHAASAEQMERKRLSLEIEVNLTPLDELEDLLKSVKNHADLCSDACKTIAYRITEFRQTLQTSNADDLKKDLDRARATVDALSADAQAWRKRYRDAQKDVADKEKVRQEAETALDAYCKRTYAEFQQGINKVLKDFRLRFTIEGLEPRSTQQSSQVSAAMSLVIDGHPISAAKRQETSACFKNTLSEGEKNALAFAFFLAELRRHADLCKEVIVIDDPLSSFDDDRRLDTARHLGQLAKECRQLIVLTHRIDFLWLLYDQDEFDGRFFRLRLNDAEGARIELLDVKETRMLEHERHVKALKRFAESGDLPVGDNVKRLIRDVLECVLRTKYCPHLQGERSFSELLKRLDEQLNLLDGKVAEDLRELNKSTQGGLHAASDRSAMHSLTDSELQGLASRALATMDGI